MKTIKEILFTAVIGSGWVALIFGLGWVLLSFGLSLSETSSGLLADNGTAVQQGVELEVVQLFDSQLEDIRA